MEKIAGKCNPAVALSLAAAFLFLTTTIAPPGAWAGGGPTACESVSLAFVQKTLGLHHSALARNHSNVEETAGLEPSELPRAAHSVCGIGVWDGTKPGNRAARLERARAGQAALVGVDAWGPNDESPSVGEWESTEFDELTAGFLKGRFEFLKVPGRAKPLNPDGDGYIGAGLLVKATGNAHGLEAAAGCWWAESTHRAICVVDEEAEGRPVVKHLNALANKIVPNFLGAH